jgi:hypothetical protein
MASDGRMVSGEITITGGMAERTKATVLKTVPPAEGADSMPILSPSPRIVNGVTWAFAPDWLTIEEACFLSGRNRDYLLQVLDVDGVDLNDEGLIEKRSLWEWLETSVEIDHWDE